MIRHRAPMLGHIRNAARTMSIILFIVNLISICYLSVCLSKTINQYPSLHRPLEDACGFVLVDDDLQLDGRGLHGVEIDGAGGALLDGIGIGVLHRQPLASGILVVEFPTIWHLTSLPRLVIVPIDRARLDGGLLGEGVADPFCGTLLGPPMGVGHAAVVGIARHQAVIQTRQGRYARAGTYLALRGERGGQRRSRGAQILSHPHLHLAAAAVAPSVVRN